MRVLIVAPDCPYPPRHGGRLDTWNRALALARQGAAVSVYAASDSPEEIGEQIRDGVRIVCTRRNPSLRFLLSPLPFQYESRRALISSIPTGYDWDLIILEGAYFAPLADQLRSRAPTIVLRQHNDEPSYLLQLASCERRLGRRIYLLLECLKAFGSRSVGRNSIYEYWCISEEDARALSSYLTSVRFVPPCFPDEAFGYGGVASNELCFIGRLDGADTLASLKWYFEQVHPAALASTQFTMKVAGRLQGSFALPLPEEVACIPNPESTRPILMAARALIAPIQGVRTGTKMKVAEAFCSGVEVITSPEGASGLPVAIKRKLWICSSASDYVAAVEEVFGLSHSAFLARRAARVTLARDAFGDHSYVDLVVNEPSKMARQEPIGAIP